MTAAELSVGGRSVHAGTAHDGEVAGVFRAVRPGYVEWDEQGHVEPMVNDDFTVDEPRPATDRPRLPGL